MPKVKLKTKFEVTKSYGAYRNATVEFIIEPTSPFRMQKVNYTIDGNTYFIPMHITIARAIASVWLFSKNADDPKSLLPKTQHLSDKEVKAVLEVSKDILTQETALLDTYKAFFEILPRQARIYKKYYSLENPTLDDRTKMLSDLAKSNIIIKRLNQQAKRALTPSPEQAE